MLELSHEKDGIANQIYEKAIWYKYKKSREPTLYFEDILFIINLIFHFF